jgi:hypothetical protein
MLGSAFDMLFHDEVRGFYKSLGATDVSGALAADASMLTLTIDWGAAVPAVPSLAVPAVPAVSALTVPALTVPAVPAAPAVPVPSPAVTYASRAAMPPKPVGPHGDDA